MLAVVIPVRNEAQGLNNVLRMALALQAAHIIPVLNGCTDMSPEIVARMPDRRLTPLHFPDPLGYDVPRIAGAQLALKRGALGVLFLDGDLTGHLNAVLHNLTARVKAGADLALTDCYAGTAIPFRDSAARSVYQARLALNAALGRPDLGPAIPSHGPVAVSRRLLETVPLASLGVPPLMQAHACRAGLRVEVGARVPHQELGSARRGREHGLRIAETILGDCEMGRRLAQDERPDRGGHLGYHPERRFDLVGVTPPEEAVRAGRALAPGEPLEKWAD